MSPVPEMLPVRALETVTSALPVLEVFTSAAAAVRPKASRPPVPERLAVSWSVVLLLKIAVPVLLMSTAKLVRPLKLLTVASPVDVRLMPAKVGSTTSTAAVMFRKLPEFRPMSRVEPRSSVSTSLMMLSLARTVTEKSVPWMMFTSTMPLREIRSEPVTARLSVAITSEPIKEASDTQAEVNRAVKAKLNRSKFFMGVVYLSLKLCRFSLRRSLSLLH